jgi:hypothetical protein
MAQTCAFTAFLRRATILKSERDTHKDVTTRQGTCISEIKPSNAIVGFKKMKKIIITASVAMASLALAYLPSHWSPEDPASAFEKADAVVVARVIGLNRSAVTNRPAQVDFHAKFIVARNIKGDLNPTDQFSFLIGTEAIDNISDEAQPSYGFLLHGTQQSYHFDINGVYLLFLSKTEDGWTPRSGPYSVFRIQKEKVSKQKERLVVIPRDNKSEAHDHVIRQIREPSRVLLDEFLKNKKKKTQPEP